jgi:lysophospholipase L1-like esterase
LLGDSITEQYSLGAVPTLLAQGYDVRARGIGGTGLLDANECRGQRATATLTQDDPDIVILQNIGNYGFNPACDPTMPFGTEAFYGAWHRAAQQVTDILRSRGGDVVWMLNPPVPAGSPWETSVLRFNDIYRFIALGTPGVGIVDAFNPFGGRTFDATVRAADGVHLNASGVTRMAALVNRAVIDATNSVALPPPVLVAPVALPAGRAEADYLATLTATGGVAPHSWSVTSGSLPPGLALSGSGTLSGTPTAAGTFTFTVQVADAKAGKHAESFVITVAPPPVSVSTTSPADGRVGSAYATTLVARGGIAPYSWTVTSGSLPGGLALSSSGEIAGTPTTAGTFAFMVQAADSDAPTGTATRSLSVTVAPPPISVSTASLAGGMVASPYSTTLAATGGLPPYSWSLAAGSLPPGLTLNSSGRIAGTPTAAGTFPVTVRVTDSASPARVSTKALSILVVPAALRITTVSLPAARVSQVYVATLTAIGGTAPYRWTKVGALPAGLQLDRKAGIVFGTPKKIGTFTVTMQVKDKAAPASIVTKVLSITVG